MINQSALVREILCTTAQMKNCTVSYNFAVTRSDKQLKAPPYLLIYTLVVYSPEYINNRDEIREQICINLLKVPGARSVQSK